MKKSIFGGLLLTTCLVACGNGTTTGTEGTGTGGSGGGTGTSDSGAGGGTTGTGTSSDTSAFIGTWTYSTGTGTLTCPDGSETLSAMGTLTIAAGTAADTIITSSTANGDNCVTTFTVSGMSATADPGQTCTLTSTDSETGDTITEMRSAAGSFTIVNSTLTANIGGADVINEGGETEDCNIAGTITYTKAGG